MTITLSHISKRFQKHWIFKDVNYSFETPEAYALLGANGSGKSTLLRIIAGMQTPSLGKVIADNNGSLIEAAELYKYITFSAPGMELVEELTLHEFLDFHFSFKTILPGVSKDDIVRLTGLGSAAGKPIADYSSGMKQRVKLAQAIFTNTPVLLLDEPCTNLDQQGVEQYHQWVEQYGKDRLVIVASNDEREYFFCRHYVQIEQFK